MGRGDRAAEIVSVSGVNEEKTRLLGREFLCSRGDILFISWGNGKKKSAHLREGRRQSVLLTQEESPSTGKIVSPCCSRVEVYSAYPWEESRLGLLIGEEENPVRSGDRAERGKSLPSRVEGGSVHMFAGKKSREPCCSRA